MRGYGDFILQNPRYGKLRQAQGLDNQLAKLQVSGYATDPNYGSKVGQIARSIQLPTNGGAQPQTPVQVASADPNAGMQMAFAPQSEPQQPAQSALQTLMTQRNGGGQPRQQTAQAIQPAKPAPFGGVDPRLIEMMGDPSLSSQRRSTMQFLLQQHLKANAPVDPMKQLQMERLQLQNDQLRNPAPAERNLQKAADGYLYDVNTGERAFPNVQQASEPRFEQLTGEAAQAAGLDPAKAYNVGPDGKISQIGGGGVNVTVGGGDLKVPTGFKRNPDDLGAVIPILGGPQDPNTPTNSNTTQIQRVNNAASAIQEGLTAYEDLVNQYGAEVLPGKGKDALLASRRDLQLQMKELFNLGVLNGPDLDLMNELLIDPTSLATAAQGTIGGMFGGDSVQDRASANIQQLREQFERLRKSQTPEGFGGQPDDTDPLGLGKF